MDFFALLFSNSMDSHWECILPMHVHKWDLGVHYFYALPELIFKKSFFFSLFLSFQKTFFISFLILGVHDFPQFHALPKFQFFLILCFGSGSAWFTKFFALPNFWNYFYQFFFLVLGSGSAWFSKFLSTSRFFSINFSFWFWDYFCVTNMLKQHHMLF